MTGPSATGIPGLGGPAAFTYTALPAKVVFGAGSRNRIRPEIELLGCSRALVLSTPEQSQSAERVAEEIGAVGVFARATMHTPVEISEEAAHHAQELNADCVVGIGGGSTIGLGKAIALRTGLPQIAVPTTYAGSEATPILGQTEAGRKVTLRDMRVLPRVIIYDVELTTTLPKKLIVNSGLNAVAHAVEGLYAPDANPVTSSLAEQGITALIHALPNLAGPQPTEGAGTAAQFGAWACGTVLGTVGMGLHHKLCHVLGGTFDLPHAETHATLIPYVTAFNEASAPQAMQRIARALGAERAADPLRALAQNLGAPTSLSSLGMPEDGIEVAAELATAAPYPNPRPFDRGDIERLLWAAHSGVWPGDLA